MRRLFRLLFLVSAAFVLPTLAAIPGEALVKVTLIKSAGILDVRAGKILLGRGVLVENDRIKEIGPLSDLEGRLKEGTTVIDLGRAILLPGLIDCHAHLLAAMQGRMGPGENIIATITLMSPAKRALQGAANARDALEAGFTTVRNVGHSGIDGDAALREAVNAGWVPGPRILAATRKITPPGGQGVPMAEAVAGTIITQEYLPINGAEEARRAVREALYAGADVIKVVMDDGPRVLTAEEVKAIVTEAHRSRVKVAAHATTRIGIQAAVDAGVDSVEHGDEASDESLKAMHDKGIFLVPTDWTAEAFLGYVKASLVFTEAELKEWDRWMDKWIATSTDRLRRARKLGVKIAAGSDMWVQYPEKNRGEATRLMFDALQKEGMPPLEILRAATVNAAELLGWQDRVGALEAGKLADLIAVEGNPLQDLTSLNRVLFVMKGGEVVLGKPVLRVFR